MSGELLVFASVFVVPWVALVLAGWALFAARRAAGVSILSLGPRDVVVVEVAEKLTAAQTERLAAHVKDRFPENQVLVLDASLSLSVMADDMPPPPKDVPPTPPMENDARLLPFVREFFRHRHSGRSRP